LALKKLVSLLAGLLFTIISWSQTCDLRIAGHVEDLDSKQKLAGATVKLVGTDKVILTNDEGNFIFGNLCRGKYILEISHVDCATVTREIVLEKNFHQDIFLPHAQNTLEEVTVSAIRGVPNTAFKQEVSGRQMEETRGTSLAEALDKLSGVTTLKTGSNVSKPVIHGLHGNRVLIINNGIRQEGQQWGNEHAPEVDPFIADKISVIKGVDELKYGSDAIGGVILVDAKPLKHLEGTSGELYTGYSTNGGLYYGSGNVEKRFSKIPLALRLQGTFRKSGNIKTPDYFMNNTGLEEYNYSLTAGWKKEHFNIETYLSHFYTKAGIFSGAHIGNLSDLEVAINAEKPDDVFTGEETYRIRRPFQQVEHTLGKIKSTFSKGDNKFYITIGAQRNRRREYDKSRSDVNTQPQLDLLIYTFTEDLSWEHKPIGKLKGTIGLSLMQQDNSFGGRYFIPNYFSNTIGGYWLEKLSLGKFDLHAGVRFDHKTIETKRLLSNGGNINYDFDFSTLASSFNAIYKHADHFRLIGALNLSSRAPHVNELLSNGIHHGSATYEEGDINLKTEKALNTSLTMEWETFEGRLDINATAYNNRINDFIYRKPVPDEPVLTIAGAFPKIVFSQTDATLNGFDLDLHGKITNELVYHFQYAMLRAKDRATDDWLIYMPADRITNGLTWNFKEGKKISDAYLSLEMTSVFEQKRVPSDKNGKQDYKVPPGAYNLVDADLSGTFDIWDKPVTIGLSVNNLFNVKYRDYLNSFRYFTDEMGRNISIKLKIPFNNFN
jgi:iron complex outermembrane recepter protein